jgi:hypothetical protein
MLSVSGAGLAKAAILLIYCRIPNFLAFSGCLKIAQEAWNLLNGHVALLSTASDLGEMKGG